LMKSSLDELGLNHVSEDFIKRGILTGNESTPSKETSREQQKQ